MGFPLGDVLTSDALVEEFQCKICHNLVEYAQCSYTSCSHVFCEGCLSDWMARSADADELRGLIGQGPGALRPPAQRAARGR